jgi:hypothetical protein
MPTESPDATPIFGMHWGAWQVAPAAKPAAIDWWRNDTGLLANTRAGAALPVGTLEILRDCTVEGDATPLARLPGNANVLMRAAQEPVYFLGLLPDPGSSSLARDGVVMFALLQRALNEGSGTLGKARQGLASAAALGADAAAWHPVSGDPVPEPALHASVLEAGDRLLALNRPPAEDSSQVLSTTALNELFAGLDYRVLTGTLSDNRSLTNEVWRTFLICMALAIIGEALLCLPPKRLIAAAT